MAENRLTVSCVDETGMLTDVTLKNLKPREKAYKVTDRDGLYVQVSTSGTLTFRLDDRLHGRRETLNREHGGSTSVKPKLRRRRRFYARRFISECWLYQLQKLRRSIGILLAFCPAKKSSHVLFA